MSLEREGKYVFTLAAKIDESDPPRWIAKLAPLHRHLTQAAVAVNPNLERSKSFGV
jgi:hypothetical protein